MSPKPTCMHCGELIADTSAPARFCSRACFDALLEKVNAQWNQRFREAKSNGNGAGNGAVSEVKPLSEIMQGLKARKPPKHKLPADFLDRLRAVHGIQPTPSLKRRNW